MHQSAPRRLAQFVATLVIGLASGEARANLVFTVQANQPPPISKNYVFVGNPNNPKQLLIDDPNGVAVGDIVADGNIVVGAGGTTFAPAPGHALTSVTVEFFVATAPSVDAFTMNFSNQLVGVVNVTGVDSAGKAFGPALFNIVDGNNWIIGNAQAGEEFQSVTYSTTGSNPPNLFNGAGSLHISTIPEPSSVVMMVIGLSGLLLGCLWRRVA